MTGRRQALAAVDALGTLLRKEIAAVESGDFGELVKFSGEKARLSALLEKELQDDPQAVSRDQLRDLKQLIMRDEAHLQLARSATAEMICEISGIRERHSIAGLYGRSGAKRDRAATLSAAVDKSF